MTRQPRLTDFSSALLSRLRLLLLCVAALPLLSGCAWLCSFCAGTTPGTMPKQVAAVVLDTQPTLRVVVFPEPIRYRLPDGPGAVEWRLPAGAGLRFPPEGAIRFQAEGGGNQEIVNCRPVGRDGLAFQCLNRATRAGTFKYDITVVPPPNTNDGRPVRTDPSIVNAL